MKPGTCSDNAPVVVLLRTYYRLWIKNPLWLVGLPGVTDPRRNRWQALDDACRMIDEHEFRLVNRSARSLAAIA